MPPPASTQALLKLLPHYNHTTLPPRLSSLAEALLAQSRQRAAHLKPEEEIARTYACAELACDKLRAQLRLPTKKPGKGPGGPPCKPTVYKKLLSYLERVLDQDAESLLRTPKKRKAGDGGTPTTTPSKKQRTTSVETPTRSGKSTNRPFAGKVKDQARNQEIQDDTEAPAFVMPAIRKLCKTFNTPSMAPHVYTGTCIVLQLAELWPRPEDPARDDSDFEADITAVVIALYLMVLTRMNRGNMTTEIFESVSSKAMELFDILNDEKRIKIRTKWLNSEGHCRDQPWYDSVPEDALDFDLDAPAAVATEFEADQEADNDIDEAELMMRRDEDREEEDPEGVLLPGLHTMMQPAVDWCSEERKATFVKWKRDFTREIERKDAKDMAFSERSETERQQASAPRARGIATH